MKARLIRLGNFQVLILPQRLLNRYHLAGEVNVQPVANGLLLTPVLKPARQGWDEQFKQAAALGHVPDGELL